MICKALITYKTKVTKMFCFAFGRNNLGEMVSVKGFRTRIVRQVFFAIFLGNRETECMKNLLTQETTYRLLRSILCLTVAANIFVRYKATQALGRQDHRITIAICTCIITFVL